MKMFFKQWSFVWGGFFIGLAEVIYFLKFKTPIPITTGLAKMFGTVEANVTKTDLITRLYPPDIHWVIIGILAGGVLVIALEREHKAWVKYPLRMTLLAFLGGAIFGLGTRIAQGCTTWHYLGGIPAMSLTSIAVAVFSIPFAYGAFMLMARMNVGGYMKHNEMKTTAMTCSRLGLDADTVGYDPGYKPFKDPVRLVLTAMFAVLLVSSLWTAFKGGSPEGVGVMAGASILIKLLVGFLLGFGIGKSGFGTECAVMAPHSLHIKRQRFESMGVASITQTMFTGLMPFTGLLIAILMLNIAILVTWMGFGWQIPVVVEAGQYQWGFHLGHLVGGALLGIGAVLMIGCEIRTYARASMGYLTGVAALPGFFVGYLPYTLYQQKFDGFFFAHGFITEKNMLEFLPDSKAAQYTFALAYTAILLSLLVWAVWRGSRMIKVSAREYVTKSTDEVFLSKLPEGAETQEA